MAHILAQVAFHGPSGLPDDTFVNTFHFDVASLLAAEQNKIDTALTNFYTTAGGSVPLDSFLNTNLSNLMTIKQYDDEAAPPRVPLRTTEVAIDPAAATPLPSEVAVCVSFQGTPTTGVEQRNRRGRIYFGPLGSNALEVVNGITRVHVDLRSVLVEKAEEMAAALEVVNVAWVVKSQVLDNYTIITNGWVDNSFDIIRKRGEDPSLRSTWTLVA